MAYRHSLRRYARLGKIFPLMVLPFLQAGQSSSPSAAFPYPETLTYRVEWRMITAGEAKLQLTPEQQNWQIRLDVQSAGLVSRLFRVQDSYKMLANGNFCGLNSSFEGQEGKRHVVESMVFDNGKHRATFDLHDYTKNSKEHSEIDIAPCTHDIIGALESLRLLKLELGKSVVVPIANAKKMAYAKIEAQTKENVLVDGKSYSAFRYEAYIFDNVVFRRRGSLFIWLTDDAARLPVQMRFEMGFPIGNVTLGLTKVEQR